MGEYVHSQQVRFSSSSISCGVLEVHHLPADTTGNQMVFAITNQLYNKASGRPAAFVLFSDVTGMQNVSRGELLADAITSIGLGSLFVSERVINPKTGNIIILWMWTLNHESLREWYTEEFANRIDA